MIVVAMLEYGWRFSSIVSVTMAGLKLHIQLIQAADTSIGDAVKQNHRFPRVRIRRKEAEAIIFVPGCANPSNLTTVWQRNTMKLEADGSNYSKCRRQE
jgi:predicted DNA-binding helix-hairpin-helix protein